MTESVFEPQLQMRRRTLTGLPAIELPPGYAIRSFREGDGAHWARILVDSFGGELARWSFDEVMRSDVAFQPERVFFVTCHDEPIATASAWNIPARGSDVGTLHYVACCGAHTGHALGRAVSLAALEQMIREGRTWASLSTDDFRLPAIKTYLRMGFEPLLIHENQRQRWPVVFAQLGMPEMETRFADQLAGPIWSWGT